MFYGPHQRVVVTAKADVNTDRWTTRI